MITKISHVVLSMMSRRLKFSGRNFLFEILVIPANLKIVGWFQNNFFIPKRHKSVAFNNTGLTQTAA